MQKVRGYVETHPEIRTFMIHDGKRARNSAMSYDNKQTVL